MPRDVPLPVRDDWSHVHIPDVVWAVLQAAALVLKDGIYSFSLRTPKLAGAEGEYAAQLTPYHDGRIFLRVVFPKTQGWFEFGVPSKQVKKEHVRQGEDPIDALARQLMDIGHPVSYGL